MDEPDGEAHCYAAGSGKVNDVKFCNDGSKLTLMTSGDYCDTGKEYREYCGNSADPLSGKCYYDVSSATAKCLKG